MSVQMASCYPELLGRHALIEFLQRFWVHRFQTHRNFKLGAYPLLKMAAALVHQRWMAFYDDPLEATHKRGNRAVILRRNSTWIKKAAAVVEFDLPRGWHTLQRIFDLPGDVADRDGVGKSVAP